MTWKDLLKQKRVHKHTTSKAELDNLRAVVARDLHDAAVTGLSDDRKFATAYNAILQLSKMAIACAGYRAATHAGHHQTSFEALELAMGSSAFSLAAYFDACRRKRNQIDYDQAHAVTETEAREICEKAKEFQQLVEQWIATQFPALKP